MAAFLGKIGGREVDRDSSRRKRETRGDQRGTHPFARLRHRLVGQSNDGESRQPRGDLDLDVDRTGLDSLKRHRGNALDHATLSEMTKVAESGEGSKNNTGTGQSGRCKAGLSRLC